MKYMKTLNNLETSYNRKVQVRLFHQLDLIDQALLKYKHEKNQYKFDFLDKANPIATRVNQEKSLSRGYRKDYREALKVLRNNHLNKSSELKEYNHNNIKEEKQFVKLVMSKIDSNYKKYKLEFIEAAKQGKTDIKSKLDFYEQEFKMYRELELEKRIKEKELKISKIKISYKDEVKANKNDYKKNKEALINLHKSSKRKNFKKEKRMLITKYKKEIMQLKKEKTAHELANKDNLKIAYRQYKVTKKAAKVEIKKIKKEARIAVSKMSQKERSEYRSFKKYIRDDFRVRRLKRLDAKERAIMKNINPAYIYIAPAFFGAMVFTLIPFLFMIIGSLFRVNFANLSQSSWVGLDNFIRIFTKDIEFQKALSNTAIFAFLTILLLTVITITMAAWLSKNTKIHNLAQSMVFTPHIASLVSISILWIAMLNPTGLINQALAVFGIEGPAWLLQENTSLFAVSLVTVWKDIGYYVLIIIAGLQGIPVFVYEAAKLDKSSKSNTFFKITLPLLAPTLSFVFLAKFINAFKVFAPIEIMTNGGPMGSSMVLSYWIYKVGRIGFNYGQAMSGAIVLTVMITIVTVLKNVYFNKVFK